MPSPSGQGLFIVSNVNQISNPINGLSWAFVSNNGLYAFNNNIWSLVVSTGAQPYYMAFGFTGKPSNGQYVLQTPGQTVTLPANLSTSSANIGTNPTSTAVFTFAQNGTQIATISVATNGAVTFATTGGAVQVLHAGDQIKLTAPASQDTTLADVALTIAGTR